MKRDNIIRWIIAGLVLLITLACNALVSASAVTPSPLPPTATSEPLLSQQVTLISQALNENNQTPPFRITAQTPQLAGSDDPRVTAFNERLNGLVSKEVDTFRQSFLQNTLPPMTETGSFLDVTYTLTSQNSELWSFKFDFAFYSDGAAHPGHYSIALNYDLGRGEELALSNLFLANSNYLELISNYCIAELSKQPGFEGPFQEGAAPTPENYRNWNLTSEGLMITFNEYQVMPYASGPQTIIVPYHELQTVIDPQGPLAKMNE